MGLTYFPILVSNVGILLFYTSYYWKKWPSGSHVFEKWPVVQKQLGHTVIGCCYEVGYISHTNWRCCTLDHDSGLCIVKSFLFLFHLYTFRLPDSFEHLMCATLFLFTTSFGFVRKRRL